MLYEFGRYAFDDATGVVEWGDRRVKIERLTLRLLTYLIRHRDRVVPKDELIEVLWNGDAVSESSLPRCVSELRAALGTRSRRGDDIIETVYGRGYRFRPSVQIQGSSPVSAESGGEDGRWKRLPSVPEAAELLEMAVEQTRSGAFEDARSKLMSALQLARDAEDGELFARIAIALQATRLLVYANAQPVRILEEAELRWGAPSTPLGLELRAELQVAKLPTSAPEVRCEAVRQNVAEALRLGDPHVRARVLLLSHRALEGPGTASERRDLSVRASRAAHFVGTAPLQAEAAHARLADALTAGDIAHFDAELPEFCMLARATGHHAWKARAALAESLLAFLRGQYSCAIELRDDALSLLENGSEDHRAVHRATAFAIGRERNDERMRLAQSDAQADWREPVTFVSMALSLHYCGLPDDARRVFEVVPDEGSRSAKPSRTWKSTIALCAEAAFLFDDPEMARSMVREISRSGNVMPSLDAFLCLEPLDYFLALAKTCLESWAEAEGHFRTAIAWCQRMGTPAFEARITYALATMLSRQDERERGLLAYENACRALEMATALGMDRLQCEAQALAEGLAG